MKTGFKNLFIATVLMFSINGCNNDNTSLDTPISNNADERVDFRHIDESSDVRWLHYFRKGDYQSSLEMLYFALELVELRDLHQIAEYYNRAGWLHSRLGNYELSEFYLNRALQMAQIDNDALARLRALRNLVALNASGANTKELLKTTMGIKVVRDLLLIKQYEAEQRNNKLLVQKVENAQRKRSFILILITIFGLVLTLAIVGLLFYRNRMREITITVRHYEELLKLKKGVKPQHTDSEKTDDSEKKLALELQQLFETEKIYRQQGLNVDDVVKRLNTNSKYLSNVISQYYGKNFTGYVNTFRVDEAIDILKQQQDTGSKYANYTIQAVAEEVGFSGKSSFYLAFNKIIGVSPLEYIKALYNNAEDENTEVEAENKNTEQ